MLGVWFFLQLNENILSIKKHKIKTISLDGISSLPTQRFLRHPRHFEIFLRRLKLLILNPIIFLNRVSFAITSVAETL